MRKLFHPLLILFAVLISACSTGAPPATPEVVGIYSTSAAEPWLHELYDCAGTAVILSRVDSPSAAQIALRVGEPKAVQFAFQIDTEDILIVTNRQSPVNRLTLEEARALFLGRGDPSIQIWVYSSGTDVGEIFEDFLLEGRTVTPAAQIAVHPQGMSDTLVNQPNAVGILPRHWKAGDTREVYSIATVPVLAITRNEPQGTVQDLVACLQKDFSSK